MFASYGWNCIVVWKEEQHLCAKEVSPNSFKNGIAYKLYLTGYKQMTVKLLLLPRNSLYHLIVYKKKAQARFGMLSTKCVYNSYILNI